MKYFLFLIVFGLFYACSEKATAPKVIQEAPTATIYVRTINHGDMYGYVSIKFIGDTTTHLVYAPNIKRDTVDQYFWSNGYEIDVHHVYPELSWSDTSKEWIDFWNEYSDTSFLIDHKKAISPRGDSAYYWRYMPGIAKFGPLPFDTANPYCVIKKWTPIS